MGPTKTQISPHYEVQTIRISRESEMQIEKSVLRVTVCHHEALPSDAIFLHTFRFPKFNLKVEFITIHNDVDVGHFEI